MRKSASKETQREYKSLKNLYNKIEEYVPLVFFLLIFFLMAIQVFTRYIFNFTLAWNIELVRYSFVWITFVGAAYVRKEDSHIKIDILFNYAYNKMSLNQQKFFWSFKELLTIFYLIALIVFGYILAYRSRRFLSQAMQISQFYLYISVTVGSLFFLIREIQDIIVYYRKHFISSANESIKEFSN
jgi:TRAP-type C4-dicarboxylate transport system permease small subunit